MAYCAETQLRSLLSALKDRESLLNPEASSHELGIEDYFQLSVISSSSPLAPSC